MKKTLLSIATICLLSAGATAQQSESSHQAKAPEQIGKMAYTEFQQINAKGTEAVNTIQPTATKLSEADQALFSQVALGGMRQLAISQAVVGKATNDKVKLLAQSEVEEQTAVSAKLKELAAAKGITLPTELDPATKELVEKINAASGAEVDQLYLDEGGIKGHEILLGVMEGVQSGAADATMKALAEATLPVIKTHLEVSKEERVGMNK